MEEDHVSGSAKPGLGISDEYPDDQGSPGEESGTVKRCHLTLSVLTERLRTLSCTSWAGSTTTLPWVGPSRADGRRDVPAAGTGAT